jgi:hypothetical protein
VVQELADGDPAIHVGVCRQPRGERIIQVEHAAFGQLQGQGRFEALGDAARIEQHVGGDGHARVGVAADPGPHPVSGNDHGRGDAEIVPGRTALQGRVEGIPQLPPEGQLREGIPALVRLGSAGAARQDQGQGEQRAQRRTLPDHHGAPLSPKLLVTRCPRSELAGADGPRLHKQMVQAKVGTDAAGAGAPPTVQSGNGPPSRPAAG